MSEQDAKPPKVFISYSWSSPEHEARVIALANRLIADGVEVVIDKYDLVEGQDLHAFMERMVTDPSVTHVLVVTDGAYAAKANSREKGVGKEAQIISSEVYAKVEQTKFLPLVFEFAGNEPCVPAFMKGRIYVDMSTPEREADNYEGLLRRLYGKPIYKKPVLGKAPSFLLEAAAVVLPTTGKLQSARKAIQDGRPFADTTVEEYFQTFSESLERIRLSPTGEGPFDERFMANINAFLPYRDEFVQFVDFLAGYRDADQTWNVLADFFESITKYFGPPEGVNQWSPWWYDNFKFLMGELFMHTVAALIRKKRFAAAHSLLSREYRNERRYAEDPWETFVAFWPGVETLENQRKQRLKLNFISMTADTLKKRATGHPTRFDELMQADLILFLASTLKQDQSSVWTSYTLLYASRYKPLDLFARAESKRQFASLKALFGVVSKDEMLARLAAAGKRRNIGDSIWISAGPTEIEWARLANLQKLDTRP